MAMVTREQVAEQVGRHDRPDPATELALGIVQPHPPRRAPKRAGRHVLLRRVRGTLGAVLDDPEVLAADPRVGQELLAGVALHGHLSITIKVPD